ncbi:hypothetical protein SLEP1_g46985 [Rubroshorea leprosula]|uniref:Uncharacterized protein n=1 Tax=Rubroshorea leprosula TaxID=152421 RepID=A0AAV5LRQ8_9ROSI|nr:hypothetical protein SLEP1_g46985 [Rubroshorea leprosula]
MDMHIRVELILRELGSWGMPPPIFNDKLLKIRVKSAYKQQSKSRKILFQANQGAEFYGFLFQVGPCHFLPILVEMAVGAILWSLESLLRTWHEKIWLPLIFND